MHDLRKTLCFSCQLSVWALDCWYSIFSQHDFLNWSQVESRLICFRNLSLIHSRQCLWIINYNWVKTFRFKFRNGCHIKSGSFFFAQYIGNILTRWNINPSDFWSTVVLGFRCLPILMVGTSGPFFSFQQVEIFFSLTFRLEFTEKKGANRIKIGPQLKKLF